MNVPQCCQRETKGESVLCHSPKFVGPPNTITLAFCAEKCPKKYVNAACGESPPVQASAPVRPAGGPGTELARILRAHGISADEAGCRCKARAHEMDARGPEWCLANLEVIVGWMREEARRRGGLWWWLWSDRYARYLARRAIRTARERAY